jgi:hypothetical protein
MTGLTLLLDAYRNGERALPTYAELQAIDAAWQAQEARHLAALLEMVAAQGKALAGLQALRRAMGIPDHVRETP